MNAWMHLHLSNVLSFSRDMYTLPHQDPSQFLSEALSFLKRDSKHWVVPSVFGTLLHDLEVFIWFIIGLFLISMLKLSKKTGLVHEFGNVAGC
ncbi:hypothetical protein PENARI_c015G08017 [Penicillium arizonense]|uniref:Uncharacterized protein n=1 Tax=Penicillium arizonense TaxID=1835702 RepID=A0A1F5LDL5_PENAI|nr:hypothetical protein PENARI_c015G08017 [Penicillium arizonense]OGE51019.1 hypothetical protein PENARI_c015G08017 [Penicillium arizonense]